jgi:hypothetical protein
MIVMMMLALNPVAQADDEEFRLPTYDADETSYFVSPKSDLDGVCRMLTGNDEATALAASFGWVNAVMVEDEGVHPYELAVIETGGQLKKLQKLKTGLFSKPKFIETIHCQ